MKDKGKEFEGYKAIHNFLHPDEPLKRWINEDSFNNIYKSDWNTLMYLVEAIEDYSIVSSFEISLPTIFIWNSAEGEESGFHTIQEDVWAGSKMNAVYHACLSFVEWIKANNYE